MLQNLIYLMALNILIIEIISLPIQKMNPQFRTFHYLPLLRLLNQKHQDTTMQLTRLCSILK